MQYDTYTNIGNGDVNEDSFSIAMFDDNTVLFAVADGLGGHGGGEIASRCAVNEVCSLFSEKGFYENFFEDAFMNAQKAIWKEQEKIRSTSALKTTMVLLVIKNDIAHWAHVGDSRLYIFHNGKLKKRTLDHSVPQALVMQRVIKENEIRNHPDRNRLLRVLGVRGEQPRYEVGKPFKLHGKNQFLLCTDGFWELVDEHAMQGEIRSSQNPTEWLDSLVKKIQINGKDRVMDNYTGIAVYTESKGLFF